MNTLGARAAAMGSDEAGSPKIAASAATTCKTCINPLFAWNHGDIQPEIANTWLGFVGPGVARAGRDQRTWSDHADVRPTILTLVGLRDSYVHDGRALIEIIEDHALPRSLRDRASTVSELG